MQLTLTKRCLLVVFWVSTSCSLLPGQSTSPIQLITDKNHIYFGCLAVDTARIELLQPLFEVFSERPTPESLPMLGQFQSDDGQYYFIPRFPFRQGTNYWIAWSMRSGQGQLTEIEIPILKAMPTPELVAIYPSTDRWPANQLKFYLQFDQPMREGVALQFIQLLDEAGVVVDQAFLEMGQELWDLEQKQLTVWFDPGRIKTGLIPNEKLGPPLLEDRMYQLKIGQGYPAKNGKTLMKDGIKRFQTSSKDQKRPDPSQWQLDLPVSGTFQPLIVQFPEPLDYGLLKKAIWVENAKGEVIPGNMGIGNLEESWQWTPTRQWEEGEYRLRIARDLEDLAGNNLERLFDTPMAKARTEKKTPMTSLKFRLEPRK